MMAVTYQEKSDASNNALHKLLISKELAVIYRGAPQQIPEVEQRFEQGAHVVGLVGLAVVGGQPATGAGDEQSAVGPAIGVNRMDEDDVAFLERQSHARFGGGMARLERIEGSEEVVEDGRGVWRQVLLGAVWGRGRRHLRLLRIVAV